jgi:hypothetical protein
MLPWYPSERQGSVATCEMETALQNRINVHYMSLKADRSDSSVAEIAGSNPAGHECLYVVLSCVGRRAHFDRQETTFKYT